MLTAITPEVYTSMGLNRGEFERIVQLLGREPNYTELGMFAVMWSEHCGYKYSRPVLGYFKKYREAMEGAGLENAGVVDIGDGIGVTMKVESHNHPSAVEPYQGAATGVGGIIRDILTMGARPIAGLNSLRFGPIQPGSAPAEVVERNRYLFEHVVAGIAGYGNCVGVPTVAGEVSFHPRYSGNPLVNAMCVGVMNLDELTTAAASGDGNPVIYLGSATGKDGIHGATFASDALGEDSDAKRPNVQIGDPFAEKLLIEATLEALQTGAIVAIQDMGAAGLTCSTIEMSAKGDVGMDVDLDLVPMRESDMSGYELMLSESQERMLAVAHKGRENEVLDVFHKWGLKAVVIGTVTSDGLTTVRRHGEIVAQLPPKLLADECPTYQSSKDAPAYFEKAAGFDGTKLYAVDPNEALLKLLASPEIASKRWVYEQYDQQVQTQTALVCGAGDAAVMALRGTRKGISMKIDGNSRQTMMHPYRGGQLAVVEACRNVACTGAKPVALTDGLNFGNPTNSHVFWQFDNAVKGIADAAEAMGTPVISGNVSFYNESDLGEVPPTPLIGALGVLEVASNFIGGSPKSKDCSGLILAVTVPTDGPSLGASAYLAVIHGVEDGYPTAPNLAGELELCDFLVEATAKGILLWAHDASEGGDAVALAEVSIAGAVAVKADLGNLFGEAPGVVFVGVESDAKAREVEQLLDGSSLTVRRVGMYGPGHGLSLSLDGHPAIDLTGEALSRAYDDAVPDLMNH